MQRDSLRLRAPHTDIRVSVRVVGSPSEITFSGDEVAILATKTQDTEAALDSLLVSANPQVPVFCAQNGVENERLAARRKDFALALPAFGLLQVWRLLTWCVVVFAAAGG